MRIFTVGYGRHTPLDLLELAKKHDALLVDIRYYPWGKKRPEWQQRNLHQVFGERYRFIRALGNEEFGTGVIRLHDYPAGLAAIQELVRAGQSIILFCACARPETCHRSEVAKTLDLDGYKGIKELSFPKEPSPWDDPEGFFWGYLDPAYDKFLKLREWAKAHPDKMTEEYEKKLRIATSSYSYYQDRWDAFKKYVCSEKGQKDYAQQTDGRRNGGDGHSGKGGSSGGVVSGEWDGVDGEESFPEV